MSRLEEIKERRSLLEKGIREGVLNQPLLDDFDYLTQQAERVEELEKERSEWKGKHSILKNKYKGLQRTMNGRWRYNRAVQNESKANKAVLEKFREENKSLIIENGFLQQQVDELGNDLKRLEESE